MESPWSVPVTAIHVLVAKRKRNNRMFLYAKFLFCVESFANFSSEVQWCDWWYVTKNRKCYGQASSHSIHSASLAETFCKKPENTLVFVLISAWSDTCIIQGRSQTKKIHNEARPPVLWLGEGVRLQQQNWISNVCDFLPIFYAKYMYIYTIKSCWVKMILDSFYPMRMRTVLHGRYACVILHALSPPFFLLIFVFFECELTFGRINN